MLAAAYLAEHDMHSIRFSLLSSLMLLSCAACQPSPAPDVSTGSSKPASPPAALPSPSVPNPVATPAPAVAEASIQHWQCGEILLDARLQGEAMRLDFSGRTLSLAHTESLTGARYADRQGNEFMHQGEGAKLILAGEEWRDCSRSQRVSPWSEAASRGVVFRAVGSEPGWFVEVGKGEAPPLHATLDYGDRKIDLAHVQPDEGGYAGSTSQGSPVALAIKREPCHDGMSGEAFEASAQLIVGSKTYRGCGAFLGD